MRQINLRKENKNVTVGIIAIIIVLFISTMPVVDFYCPWYVSVVPLLIVFCDSFGNNKAMESIIKTLIVASVYSLLSFWFIYRNYEIGNKYINDVILWLPVIYAYVITADYSKEIKITILKIQTVLIMITAITTIIGLSVYPSASRLLATGDYNDLFYKLNIGGYDYIYGSICFVPILFLLFKHSKLVWKIISAIAILLILYCVIKSQYATALVLYIAFFIISLYKFTKKNLIITLAVLIIAVLFLRPLIIEILEFLRKNVAGAYVSDRLLQVIQVLKFQTVSTSTTTDRLDKYANAIYYFINSPAIGSNLFEFVEESIGGHSTILDLLAGGGIILLGLWSLIVNRMLKYSGLSNYKSSSIVGKIVFCFILVAIVNPVSMPFIYVVLFVGGACATGLEEQNEKKNIIETIKENMQLNDEIISSQDGMISMVDEKQEIGK